METKEILVERMRTALKEKGYTQQELADKCGIKFVSICRYLQGVREPKASIVAKIASVLGVSADYLLGIGPKIPEGYVSIADLKEACKLAQDNIEYCRHQEHEVFMKRLKCGGATVLNDHAKASQFFETRYCLYRFDVPALIDAVANGTWKEGTDGTETEEA